MVCEIEMLKEKMIYKIAKLKVGGFMAYCPAMKPVIVQGDTEEEVSEKLVSVAKLYVKRHPEDMELLQSLEELVKMSE